MCLLSNDNDGLKRKGWSEEDTYIYIHTLEGEIDSSSAPVLTEDFTEKIPLFDYTSF